jgi:hypothetical protein
MCYRQGGGGGKVSLAVPSASAIEQAPEMQLLASSSIDLLAQIHFMSSSEHEDFVTAVVRHGAYRGFSLCGQQLKTSLRCDSLATAISIWFNLPRRMGCLQELLPGFLEAFPCWSPYQGKARADWPAEAPHLTRITYRRPRFDCVWRAEAVGFGALDVKTDNFGKGLIGR